MVFYLKLYAATFVGFLAIDFVWLAFVARGFYRQHLGFLLADQPNWWAAITFYLLFVAGLVVFSVAPAVQAGSLWKAFLLGSFFGLVTYATYDLTNHATVKNWPWIVTLVDLCWGMVLSSSVSCIGYVVGRWLTGR
jgi:uncharacterized membrane protein